MVPGPGHHDSLDGDSMAVDFRFAPGLRSAVVAGPVGVLIDRPTTDPIVIAVLAALAQVPTADAALDALARQGLSGMPDFGLIEAGEASRLVLRGAVQARLSDGNFVTGLGIFTDTTTPLGPPIGLIMSLAARPEAAFAFPGPAGLVAAQALWFAGEVADGAPAGPFPTSGAVDRSGWSPPHGPASPALPHFPAGEERRLAPVPDLVPHHSATSVILSEAKDPSSGWSQEPVTHTAATPATSATAATSAAPATSAPWAPTASPTPPAPSPYAPTSAPTAISADFPAIFPPGQPGLGATPAVLAAPSTATPPVLAPRPSFAPVPAPAPEAWHESLFPPATPDARSAARPPAPRVTPPPAESPDETPLPTPGHLKLSSGGTVPLSRGAILGRNPRVPGDFVGVLPHLVRIADPNRDISTQHLEVRVAGGQVIVRDLGSTNGSQVIPPGRPPAPLKPNEAVVITPGTRVVLAGAFDFVYEPD